jgi:hypothetical protein
MRQAHDTSSIFVQYICISLEIIIADNDIGIEGNIVLRTEYKTDFHASNTGIVATLPFSQR